MPANVSISSFPWLMFGFGILVSLWPFHTWAPLGYGAAPTATAMLHAGVLKKFGLYVLLKHRAAAPARRSEGLAAAPALAVPGQHSVLRMGGHASAGPEPAHRQLLRRARRASSSSAVASFTTVGVTGAVVVMVAHGLLAALSFALSGYLRTADGTRWTWTAWGDCSSKLPFTGAALVMAMMAGCGLPGFGNFVGEMLVLFGGWKSDLLICGGWISFRWFVWLPPGAP
jgi:NADH-quinone oxidoreductase subunit M